MTVTDRPEGLATGIELLAAAHQTERPARSQPSLRLQPPELRVGDAVRVPDAVEAATPDRSVTVRLPRSTEALFVAAPLVYYLGAEIDLDDDREPAVISGAGDIYRPLPPLPDLQEACSALLRRTFFLDCLVRAIDTPRLDPDGDGDRILRGELDTDIARLRDRSVGERLADYLSVPADNLETHSPEWHLSTYVAPTPANVGCLPSLLDSLSQVYLPESRRLGEEDLLDRTLENAYQRGRTTHPSRIQPQLRRGQLHTWLAPGAPVGAVKATPRAIREGGQTPAAPSGSPNLTVVCNDEQMREEIHESIAAADTRETRPVDLAVRTNVTADHLADIFTSPNRLVHYVGHCDDEGLRCADGWLDTGNLGTVRARSFVLNACGSYDQGLELVDKGAIAGAVTLRNVLDEQAATVGSTLVRLLLRGFDVGQGVDLARRRVLMGADYVAIGDGTYRPMYDGDPPTVLRLDRDGEQFRLQARPVTADRTGHRHRTPFGADRTLNGHPVERVFTESAARSVLADVSLPVIYDDRFHWSGALAGSLGE
ncbi:hypothetical protein ACKVMT_03485 [Halobacteriales archaeon Cl-PHB]